MRGSSGRFTPPSRPDLLEENGPFHGPEHPPKAGSVRLWLVPGQAGGSPSEARGPVTAKATLRGPPNPTAFPAASLRCEGRARAWEKQGHGEPCPKRFVVFAAIFAIFVALAASGVPGRFSHRRMKTPIRVPHPDIPLRRYGLGAARLQRRHGGRYAQPGPHREPGGQADAVLRQPVCTATRGSLLTGRYPWKNGTEVRVGLRDRRGC